MTAALPVVFNRGFMSREATLRVVSPVVATVADFYVLRPRDLLAPGKRQQVAVPRHVAMYLCRDRLRLPFVTIAMAFARHHSTIIYAVQGIERRLPGDEFLRAEVAELKERLESLGRLRGQA